MNSYFDKDGNEVEIDKALYGKTITKDGQPHFYVKANKGNLFDPYNVMPRDRYVGWALKNVTEEVYNFYVKFLETTSIKFKYYAERSL
jgi:hypothetical protein